MPPAFLAARWRPWRAGAAFGQAGRRGPPMAFLEAVAGPSVVPSEPYGTQRRYARCRLLRSMSNQEIMQHEGTVMAIRAYGWHTGTLPQ